jgi:hypothetical protein
MWKEVRAGYLLCTNSGLKQRFPFDRTAQMGMRVNYSFYLASLSTAKKQGKSQTLDGMCEVLIYASVNSVFREILEKIVVI